MRYTYKSFKFYIVQYSSNGEVYKQERKVYKPSLSTLAKKEIDILGHMDFSIEILETTERRRMEEDFFYQNSELVEEE